MVHPGILLFPRSTKPGLVTAGRIRMIHRVKALLLVLGLFLAAGCAMPSDKGLYAIALEGAKNGADVPADVEWLSVGDDSVMPLKNMARVNVRYAFKGRDGTRQQTYCTVWLKRVALTWVVDRCVPPKPVVAPPVLTPTNAP
jgi:hypothetical protein